MATFSAQSNDGLDAGSQTRAQWAANTAQTSLAIGSAVRYKMRRTDSGVVGGVVNWLNDTGDADRSPTAVGVQGPVSIEASWP